MTLWTRRAIILVNADVAAAAKTKAESVMADMELASAQRAMFEVVRLSTTSSEPALAFGCNTALKPAMVARWKNEFIDLNPSKVRWYLMDAANNTLIATNSPDIIVSGQAWTWQDALNDVGLQVIESEQI